MSERPPFRGPEPGTPEWDAAHAGSAAVAPDEDVARFYQAGILLARDVEASRALIRGLPVPRKRLNPKALAALGEPEEGPDIALDDELALRLEVQLPLKGDGAKPAGAETPLESVRFASLEDFANTPEEGAEAVLGDADNVVFPVSGDVMFYGDGGAGKTTLVVDFAFHAAAGDDWVGIAMPEPRTSLIIENEGPRAPFRRKLKRKLDARRGSPLKGRVSVLEEPWAAFSFADKRWRELVADYVREHEVDIVICGPLVSSGMEAAGTLQDVRDFLRLTADVRRRSGRDLLVILVHHENKGGKVSGAWEGAGDTLVHVSEQGHGRVRVHFQKARWASDFHATTLQLVWTESDGFAVEEKDELDDETLAEQIVDFVGANPGTGWTKVEKATPGVNRQRRRDVRDGLFAAGRIVNVARDEGGVDVALDHVPEARAAHLYIADDPTISHLRPGPGAVGAQSAPAWGEGASASAPRAPRPLRGAPGGAGAVGSPRPELFSDDAGEPGREEDR